ncbi:MAG TPA: tRNA adenosine(34) deaminase TadA [Bryobacteraceae bacterium]
MISDVPTFLSGDWTAADRAWMQKALALAQQAEGEGEVPIGAVLVLKNKVVGEGWNRPIGANDPTAHAEIAAIRNAAGAIRNYRLPGSTLYVTLEPCAMCAGALVNARIERVVFAARDIRFGALRSVFRLADSELLNHRVRIEEGLLAAEAAGMLKRFFERKRTM